MVILFSCILTPRLFPLPPANHVFTEHGYQAVKVDEVLAVTLCLPGEFQYWLEVSDPDIANSGEAGRALLLSLGPFV